MDLHIFPIPIPPPTSLTTPIASWKESDDRPRQCVEKKRHYSAYKGSYSQGYGLLSGHVWLWELDHKEGRTPRNWCLWTVMLEKISENPLDTRRSNQSVLRDINPEYSLEELMLKLKLQYFGHLMWTDAGKDWRWEKNGMTEDEMVRWHDLLDRHEFE